MTTALVMGSNRGIGLELCRQLKARGDDVIGVCRRGSPALDALGVRVESGVDVTSERDVADLVERLGGCPLDLLILNAGILERTELEDLDFEVIRRQLEVNALGPLRVTRALLPQLGDGSRVAVLTSRMGSIADNTSGGSYGYRMSKSAVNSAFRSLAHDLRPRGVAVAILHPGWVRTEMTGHSGLVDVEESVEGLLARLDALTLETTGRFWHMNGEELPW
jgi:NAD(P)-dependent dehydrogenase (short-subunit alcohol dehydrogenase family)